MSHKIRTPLNGVLGMADLLQKTPLDSNQKQHIDVILDSGATLLNVIDDILGFSKMEVEALTLDPIDFNVEQLMTDLAGAYRLNSWHDGLVFSASINPSVPISLNGDSFRLRQILINLLFNAFKFNKEGEIILRIDGRKLTNMQYQLIIKISETGGYISGR